MTIKPHTDPSRAWSADSLPFVVTLAQRGAATPLCVTSHWPRRSPRARAAVSCGVADVVHAIQHREHERRNANQAESHGPEHRKWGCGISKDYMTRHVRIMTVQFPSVRETIILATRAKKQQLSCCTIVKCDVT